MKASFLPILIGASLAGGATLGLLYMLFKKDEELEYNHKGVISTRCTTIKVKIPKDVVGIVIGRGGSNIKEIEKLTNTKINFREESESETLNYRLCSITGTAEKAQYAESLIHNLIRNQPLITTSEMTVPMKACGRIIGTNGENIKSITQQSGARITVNNNTHPKEKFADRRITIVGTANQIALAKSLISVKVDEEAGLRKKYEAGAANRTPRREYKAPQFITAGRSRDEEPEMTVTDSHSERLSTTSSDGMMEVYVSAVDNPDRFWVQMVSPSCVELDQLLVQMTEYYSKDENREIHLIEELRVGQYVAAPFLNDGQWYRAQVASIKVDDYAPENSIVELYYVDYGDCYNVKKAMVFELRADFLKLTFQAIECALAKVKPSGKEWTEESIDLFEDLTYNAKWKSLMCRVDHYDPERVRRQDHGQREGSPVPVVNLFDINGAKDINVADEMVKNQFAVHIPSSTAGLPSNRIKSSLLGSGAKSKVLSTGRSTNVGNLSTKSSTVNTSPVHKQLQPEVATRHTENSRTNTSDMECTTDSWKS